MCEVEGKYADANQSVISLLVLSMSPMWSSRWLLLLAQVNTSLLVKVMPSIWQRGLKRAFASTAADHCHQPLRCHPPPPWCVADLWGGMEDRSRSKKKKGKNEVGARVVGWVREK